MTERKQHPTPEELLDNIPMTETDFDYNAQVTSIFKLYRDLYADYEAKCKESERSRAMTIPPNEEITRLRHQLREFRDAAYWLLNLNNGMSKGGSDMQITNDEWHEAWDALGIAHAKTAPGYVESQLGTHVAFPLPDAEDAVIVDGVVRKCMYDTDRHKDYPCEHFTYWEGGYARWGKK